MLLCVYKENKLLHSSHSNRYIKKTQKRMLLALILFISLVCAFRSVQKTPDTAVYYNLYTNVWKITSIKSFFQSSHNVELGFEYFSKFIKLFFPNYRLYFFIITFTILALSASAIFELTDNRILSYFIFFSVFGFYYTFIVIRQGLAMAIILYTLAKTCKRQSHCYIKFIIGVLIATFFHSTAIISILMLPFINRKRKLKLIYYVFLITISLLLTYTGIVSNFIAKFAVMFFNLIPSGLVSYKIITYFVDFVPTFNSSSYLYIFTFMLVVFFLSDKRKYSKSFIPLLSIQNIGILLLGIFSGISESIRIADYFLMAESCTISDNALRVKIRIKYILISFLCLIYLGWRLSIIYRFNLGVV